MRTPTLRADAVQAKGVPAAAGYHFNPKVERWDADSRSHRGSCCCHAQKHRLRCPIASGVDLHTQQSVWAAYQSSKCSDAGRSRPGWETRVVLHRLPRWADGEAAVSVPEVERANALQVIPTPLSSTSTGLRSTPRRSPA